VCRPKTVSLLRVEVRMSSVDESTLSEVAQKELSKLRSQISVQLDIIKKEEAVIVQKGDTYICLRSTTCLENATKKLMKHDKDYEDRIEYFEDKYRKMIERLEQELEGKKKETKALFDGYKVSSENEIEKHSKIIDSERGKKTPTIIRAETALQGLREKVNKILSAWVVPESGQKKPAVDWSEVAKKQLEQMKPSERVFFEASSQKKEEGKEEVYMYKGQKVSKFEYERFTRPAPVQEPVQEPVEEPVEDEETEIDDDQLAREIDEAKQRQRHILLRLPKKPVKVIKKSGPSL